ncbi:MAG TPA: S-layer homology domain-containing protein [Acidimicrobiia bacterium]|nr:S-layer homology domain-containing protein [Acidimicrobiia bacterium]
MRRWVAGSLAAVSLLVLAAVVSTEADAIVLTGFFTDDDGHLFEADIDAIAADGITRGCNPPANTRFCPDDNVTRGEMAAFLRRALGLPQVSTDFFIDDNSSIFQGDINAIAAVGITRGCNPPANDRFCPDDEVDRGQMAAFIRRALELPAVSTDYFSDDDFSIFEADINAIADRGITKGCNPPSNTRYCPTRNVTRGEMAAFLRRALDLPFYIQQIPIGDHTAMSCSKDGERCTLVVNLSANRSYRVQEGIFQVNPATSSEESQFNSPDTSFTFTLNGSSVSMTEDSQQTSGNVTSRYWRRTLQFSSGTHTLVGRWHWNGQLIQTNTIVVSAGG